MWGSSVFFPFYWCAWYGEGQFALWMTWFPIIDCCISCESIMRGMICGILSDCRARSYIRNVINGCIIIGLVYWWKLTNGCYRINLSWSGDCSRIIVRHYGWSGSQRDCMWWGFGGHLRSCHDGCGNQQYLCWRGRFSNSPLKLMGEETTMSLEGRSKNLAYDNLLVNTSASWSCVEMNLSIMSRIITFSHTKW
jgi:hypothetical protein